MTENQSPITYRYGSNFDPNNLDTSRVVLCGLAIDCSPSIHSFESDLTRAIREFVDSSKQQNFAEELMLQLVTFSSDVRKETGFQPISAIDSSLIEVRHRNGMTAGYDAAKETLESMLSYGKTLASHGTDVRYIFIILTDGEFNDGRDTNGSSVATILDSIRKDEELYSKFTAFIYGVGDHQTFDAARKNMGIKDNGLLTFGASGSDFMNMIDCVSKSISQSSSGNAQVTF